MEENPWLDIRLSEEIMENLWSIIDNSTKQIDGNTPAEDISKSEFIETTYKWDWFYETVLKQLTEHLYYKEWINFYKETVSKFMPPSEFYLKNLWVNYQKQHDFNPPHEHEGMFSFVIFMKIPTHWKEQHELSLMCNTFRTIPAASDFQFLLGYPNGRIDPIYIPLSPEDEGRMLFFPAWLQHQVFPFYGTEEKRITLSGNIQLKDSLKNMEKKT